jgi:type VII secretion integral membrane protein EccD
VLGGWLATLDAVAGYRAAAVTGGGLLALSGAFAPLALRLGRVPMPVLPRSTADLVRDDPQPPLELVHAAVARADGLLTGMLAGTSAVVLGCEVVLVRAGGAAPVVLAAVLALGFLLRARLYPILRQRIPLLATGMAGIGCVAVGPLGGALLPAGPLAFAVAAGAIVAGVVLSTRRANPYLGRFAEYGEILLMAAIVPVVCWVLDLYAVVRGLGG